MVSIDIAAPLEMIPSITGLPTCNDNDGQITITGSGGTGSYAYFISPNPASITLSGNVFSGVSAGTFTVTITDTATSCSEDVTVVLPGAVPPTFTTSPNAITCFGVNDGNFELNEVVIQEHILMKFLIAHRSQFQELLLLILQQIHNSFLGF